MPTTSIASGVLLILVGIAGYAFSLIDGNKSWTALIPATFGVLLVALGAAAKSNEGLRKHLMHAAVVVGLLGFLIPAGRILSQISRVVLSLAVISQVSMALICLVFVILCVKSFIDARRSSSANI